MRRAPDKISDNALTKAWLLPLPEEFKHPAQAASLAGWLVHQPGVHPHWEYWLLSVVHLRDIEGIDPAKKAFPEATHELTILSLDPDIGVPDPDKPEKFRYLMPQDLVKQIASTDADAIKIAGGMIDIVIAGKMAMDSDYRGSWSTLIDNTLTHLREGCPPKL